MLKQLFGMDQWVCFEMENLSNGTIGVAQTLANLKDAITIVGGGDSAAAAIQFGLKTINTHFNRWWGCITRISRR